MPFQLRRPNGSPMDLPGEVIHLYQQARDVATAMGKIQFLRPAVLAQIIGDFGEHGLHCVERWCARPMTSLDTLQNMCEGLEPLVFEKPVRQQKYEMPGKGRVAGGEAKSVQSFLGEMKGQSPTQQKWQPSPVTSSSRKNLFSQSLAIQWLLDRGLTVEALEDYFLQAGVDQNQNRVYQLRKEYD